MREFIRVLNKVNISIFCAEEQMIDICNYARTNDYFFTILVWHKSTDKKHTN